MWPGRGLWAHEGSVQTTGISGDFDEKKSNYFKQEYGTLRWIPTLSLSKRLWIPYPLL